jgi:hypothetical protein
MTSGADLSTVSRIVGVDTLTTSATEAEASLARLCHAWEEILANAFAYRSYLKKRRKEARDLRATQRWNKKRRRR